MMRCPECQRLSVELVPVHRAYVCLRLECLWMSQKPPLATVKEPAAKGDE